MDGIKIAVTGNIAKVTEKPSRIVAGTAGLPVEFTFDSTWNGLTKVAVFQAGHIRTNRPIIEDESVVPVDVLVRPGHRLHIGVYGEAEDGTVALPTIWVNLGQIHAGATPGDSVGCDPGTAKKYYDLAMLAAADAEEAANRAVEAAETTATTYFGVPYTSAVDIIPLSDTEPVTMYLFGTAEGYDSVVTGDGKITKCVPDYVQRINRLHIEKGITDICDYFMSKAYNLKHLSFGDSKTVKHLGVYAFEMTQIKGTYDFSGLQDTTLDGVFYGCRKLEGVTFNSNVETIGYRTFYQCTELRYVDGITGVTTIGESAFQHCHKLEHLDVVPGNITLSNFAFMLSNVDAKVANTNTYLADAKWKKSDVIVPFAQNEWKVNGTNYLPSIRNEKPASVRFPIPEMDTQNSYPYNSADWTPILHPYGGFVGKNKALGGCFLFSLYHIYNILHPDASYATFYDFVTRGIMPKKITVTEALRNALEDSEVWDGLVTYHSTNATGITYEEGTEINAFDLPLVMDYAQTDYNSVGSLFWGICEALGWGDSTEYNLADATKGAEYKRMVIEEMAAGRPVIMEIVGAGYAGHGAHAVVPIGYDQETDKFLMIDSASALPTDTIPFVYWLPFEALLTPNQASSIRTFENYGEEITMTTIDENLKTLLQTVNSGFISLTGTFTPTSNANSVSIPAPSGAKMLVIQAAGDTRVDYASEQIPVNRILLDGSHNPDISKFNNGVLYYTIKYGTVDMAGNFAFAVNLGNTMTFGLDENGKYYLKSGTQYNWTAYYWNE